MSTSSALKTQRPTAVGLHAFAGLMTLGIKQAGFNVVATCEEGNFGQKTHKLNFPETEVFDTHASWPIEDLQELQPDLIYAQPACAGLSYCNVVNRGLDNPKMSGLAHCHEAAIKIRPRAYVVESVINLFKEGDPLVSAWEEDWQALGYKTTRLLENAMHIGVPQRRKRALFIAAYETNLDFKYPDPLPHYTVQDAISDLADQAYLTEGQAYVSDSATEFQENARLDNETVSWHIPQKLPECIMRLLPYYLPGLSTNNIAEDVMQRWYRPFRKTVHVEMGRPSTMLRRAVWEEESPTLCGGPRIFHPDDHRLFTVREHARLMGLPDSWEFAGSNIADAYAQCGKAVSPMVGKWVATQIKECLDNPLGREHQVSVDLISAHKAPGHVRGKGRQMVTLDGRLV